MSKIIRTCACGKKFTPHFTHPDQETCGEQRCSGRHWREEMKKKGIKRKYARRRKRSGAGSRAALPIVKTKPGRIKCIGGCERMFDSTDTTYNRICPDCSFRNSYMTMFDQAMMESWTW